MSELHMFLLNDHERIVRKFERLKRSPDNFDLLSSMCDEIEVHLEIERELAQPLLDEVNSALAEEMEEDHARLLDIIAEIGELEPGDPQVSNMVKRLQKAVDAHVKRQENQLLPLLKKRPENYDLGVRAFGLRQELLGQRGPGPRLEPIGLGWGSDHGTPHIVNRGW